ncbi:Tyrosine-protein kinase SYK [Camelus dromedarius]|uniref:Tyrosine-protein kinase SYK n=1 Tax=Camelus dromedarius TaxID=9838 RepID=A0A5N4E165_CAMDR|nr:Tyrosine-protein kinase SYK [Camelus dromedarius]
MAVSVLLIYNCSWSVFPQGASTPSHFPSGVELDGLVCVLTKPVPGRRTCSPERPLRPLKENLIRDYMKQTWNLQVGRASQGLA